MTNFKIGDAIECRTAHGTWFGAVVAGPVRNVKYGKAWKPAVAITGGGWTNVNWPIDDVRTPGSDTTAGGGEQA